MRTQMPFALLAVAFASTFAPALAHARARVFVASYGNDSGPCTFLSPCRTFQQAVNVVDAGGEVTAIDSAGFGPILIHKSVTVTSPDGVEAGIVPEGFSNSYAIYVQAGATDEIVLRGLTLNGSGVGANGIIFNSGGSLTITNCIVQNFITNSQNNLSGIGILIQPITEVSTFTITNTIVVNNQNAGIFLTFPSPNIISMNGTIDHVVVTGNGADGMAFLPSLVGSVVVGVSNSVSSNNAGRGIFVQNGTGGGEMTVSIDSTNMNSNISGVGVAGPAKTFLSRSVLTGNQSAYQNSSSPNSFFTYHDNRLNNNGAPTGSALLTATPQ
jgi:hypothetical protein